jgi:hypothetical protein
MTIYSIQQTFEMFGDTGLEQFPQGIMSDEQAQAEAQQRAGFIATGIMEACFNIQDGQYGEVASIEPPRISTGGQPSGSSEEAEWLDRVWIAACEFSNIDPDDEERTEAHLPIDQLLEFILEAVEITGE